MILKDQLHISWKISSSVLQYLVKIPPPPAVIFRDEMIHMCQETLRHLAGWFHLIFCTNTSTPLELVTPNITVALIRWSSSFFSILKTISQYFQLNSGTEGSLSKCLFETAHNASRSIDVDARKFRLVQYDAFSGGQIHKDSLECLMVLIEVINNGSVPLCGSNNNSTGVSLSEILFSFMLEEYIGWDACGDPAHLRLIVVLNIPPTYSSSMQELQGMQQKLKSCFPTSIHVAIGNPLLLSFPLTHAHTRTRTHPISNTLPDSRPNVFHNALPGHLYFRKLPLTMKHLLPGFLINTLFQEASLDYEASVTGISNKHFISGSFLWLWSICYRDF